MVLTEYMLLCSFTPGVTNHDQLFPKPGWQYLSRETLQANDRRPNYSARLKTLAEGIGFGWVVLGRHAVEGCSYETGGVDVRISYTI
jgi:hypothetical protein